MIRALLQQPRSDAIRQRLERRSELLMIVLLVLAISLSYISADPRAYLEAAEYTVSAHLPHPAILLLLTGLSLFPTKRWGAFVVAFFLVLNISTLWALHGGRQVIPPEMGFFAFMLLANVVNLCLGIALALLAKRLESLFTAGIFKPALQISLPATVFFTTLAVGVPVIFALAQASVAWLGLGYSTDLTLLALSNMITSSVVATLSVGMILRPPPFRAVLKAAPLVLGFLLIGLVDKSLGWQTERVFTIHFAIALRLMMPITSALPVTLAGIVAQRIFINDETMNWAQDYLIFSVLFASLTLFDLVLLNRHIQSKRNKALRARLLSSFEHSKFGFFIYSAKLQRFWIDELIRLSPHRILDTTLSETLRRLPPEEAKKFHRMLASQTPEPQGMTLRLSDGPVWDADEPFRVFRVHMVSETSWQYGLVKIGTVTDITEAHQASAALKVTLEELELSKDRQHRLFSLISHELRTPAAILKMLSDQMDEGYDWRDVGPRFANVLDQFLTLMDDLGSAIRDEDLLPANETAFRPNDFLQHLAGVYRLIAEEAAISINLRTSQRFNDARMTDVGRLQQILGNLIRNSIYHSGGNNLTVSYRESQSEDPAKGGTVTGIWTIEDNGKGIPEELLPGLFEPFNRDTRGVFSEAEGTGLGMYIVKLFVDTLGGDVRYAPDPMQEGARFIVTLPLKVPSETQAEARTSEQQEKRSQSILFVEDNALVADITRSQLRKQFANVTHLDRAEQALERFGTLAPDIVLTDINLPGMDGFHLAKKLRQQGFEGKIFGLSAGVIADEDFHRHGGDGILSKPLSMRHLLQMIEGEAQDPISG